MYLVECEPGIHLSINNMDLIGSEDDHLHTTILHVVKFFRHDFANHVT